MDHVGIMFLQSLSDYCYNTGTHNKQISINDKDLIRLYQLSANHSLASIVFSQYKSCPGFSAVNFDFKNSFASDVFLSVNRRDFLLDIAREFKNQKIPFICMKGAVFRDYYPNPELRSMGDIDIIIHPEDRDKTDSIMRQILGFQRMIDNHDVWTYYDGDFIFEIHTHMFYEYLASRYPYRDYFDQVWDHIRHGKVFGLESDNLFVPDENFHFLYLMTHTAKHIINKGSGFRSYLDMVFMVKKCEEQLDWTYLEEQLKVIGLLDFTRTCFALCERWFQVTMPLGEKIIDDSFYKEVTEKTMQDGVFGFDNEGNQASATTKQIRRSALPYLISSIKLTINRLFPRYCDMQLVPWYSFVDGRPWLMPAAWIYRWFYSIRHGLKPSIALLTEPFVKKKAVLKRNKMIDSWGL